MTAQASAQGELETILQKSGYSHGFVPEGSRHLFKKNNLVLTLQEYNPVFQINQFAFRLLHAPVERNGKLALPPADLVFFTNALRRTEERIVPPKTNEIKKPEVVPQSKPIDPMAALSNSVLPAKYLKSTNSGKIDFIFLDPGHGGLDPGAVAFSFFEKDLALRASFAVRTALTNRLPEVNTVMLRDKDLFMSLEDRCRIANARLRRDQNGIFVSIHLNTWFDPASRGFEVYYLSHQGWSENA
ncbi:MAG: N-acetylmuramoyl-L-alanine amidase, partial [Spirochaetia bacterium]|nr:N-acetylmuramoyl-L-alanine amidase [Spirochaetia bacterium]